MDRGTWWAIVHVVVESDTTEHTHTLIFHTLEHLEEKIKATKEAKEGS